jgi:hypothetical protein
MNNMTYEEFLVREFGDLGKFHTNKFGTWENLIEKCHGENTQQRWKAKYNTEKNKPPKRIINAKKKEENEQ